VLALYLIDVAELCKHSE